MSIECTAEIADTNALTVKTTIWLIRTRAVVSLLMFSLLLGCSEPEPVIIPELYPATDVGARTLSFLLDEKIWNPKEWQIVFGGGTGFLTAEVGDSTLIEFSARHDGQLTLFQLVLDKAPVGDTLFVPNARAYYSENSNQNLPDAWATSGWVLISRADSVARIMAGRFEFNLSDSLGRIRRIRDGRFDVDYRVVK